MPFQVRRRERPLRAEQPGPDVRERGAASAAASGTTTGGSGPTGQPGSGCGLRRPTTLEQNLDPVGRLLAALGRRPLHRHRRLAPSLRIKLNNLYKSIPYNILVLQMNGSILYENYNFVLPPQSMNIITLIFYCLQTPINIVYVRICKNVIQS